MNFPWSDRPDLVEKWGSIHSPKNNDVVEPPDDPAEAVTEKPISQLFRKRKKQKAQERQKPEDGRRYPKLETNYEDEGPIDSQTMPHTNAGGLEGDGGAKTAMLMKRAGAAIAKADEPKKAKLIHKYLGPGIASGAAGASFGALMSPKGGRGVGGAKGLVGGVANAALFKGITLGYAKALGIPYKEVVASAQPGEPSYGKQLAALAPAIAVKSLADIPKGAVEGGIESKILTGQAALKKAGKKGLGRYAGGMAGIGTAPVFFSGMQDLKSDDRRRKKKGVAKVLGSGLLYQAGKGAGEHIGENFGAKGASSLRKVLQSGSAKAIANVPSALGLAYGIHKGSKTKDKKKKYLYGALAGTAGGFGKGVTEAAVKSRHLRGGKLLKAIGAKGVARAGGGLLGGVVLTGVMDKLVKKRET